MLLLVHLEVLARHFRSEFGGVLYANHVGFYSSHSYIEHTYTDSLIPFTQTHSLNYS